MKNRYLIFLQIATSFLVAIFLPHGAFADVIHGKTQLPSFSRVLSFDEVVSLSKVKRKAYISGLRAMMTEVSKKSLHANAAGNSAYPFSQIARLLALIDSNEALADTLSSHPLMPYSGKTKVVCIDPWKAVKAGRDSSAVAGSSKDTNDYVCAKPAHKGTLCSAELMPVNFDSKTDNFYCATLDSFNALSRENKSRAWEIPKGTDPTNADAFIADTNVNSYPDAKTLNPSFVVPSNSLALARAAGTTRASGAKTPAKPNVNLGTPAVGSSVPGRASGSSAGNASGNASGNAETKTAETSPASSASGAVKVDPLHSAVIKVAPGAAKETDAAVAGVDDKTTVVVTPVTTALTSCEPPSETPKTCNPAEIEAARQKYASDKTDTNCIYAGSISTYPSVKRAYGCKAPTTFCFGSSDCMNEDKSRKTPDYSCDSGQVICNPLIFGLDADGNRLCVHTGAQATALCGSQADRLEGGLSLLDQTHSGLKESWNDFAEGLNQLCSTNQTAAALHCEECDVIRKRLFALKMASLDIATCGQAKKFEDANCDKDGKCTRPGASTDAKESKTRPKPHQSRTTSSIENDEPIANSAVTKK